MAEAPWLTIIGLGEDGPDGLSSASRNALARAEIVMGAARHLALLPDLQGETRTWPVPFADGLTQLDAMRGRNVVVLASGDPFWFGAGSVLAGRYPRAQWQAFPGRSTFQLAAAQLGWALETTLCLGLHAAPFARLRAHLVPKARAIVLVRDGPAVADLAAWITEQGCGASALWVMEHLGAASQRVRMQQAAEFDLNDVEHPVCVALEIAGDGLVVPTSSGRPDALFQNDGQITKRPVRALTLSALAPRAGEHLWDIGAGSGSISIEWLLSHCANHATAIESDPTRADRLRANADALGADRLVLITGRAPDALADLARPDAVFIGGGLSSEMLHTLWAMLPGGTRVVANAVTLETEALLAAWHSEKGGELMRIELAQAAPLGTRRGWKSAYPIVQWSTVI
ncbi:MAG: precorrin-6y C5,15-methyltransferase (decarboxylating) subunit CbiE [Sedimentitalea sp.]